MKHKSKVLAAWPAPMLSVYDGRECIGFILRRGGGDAASRKCCATNSPTSHATSLPTGIPTMFDMSSQSRRHSHAECGLDLYETPAVAVEALLRIEKIPQHVWEPAAGRGAIVRVLRDHGHAVIASDVFDYGGLDFVGDFLTQEQMPPGCEAIVTNPPFKIANEFVAHALELALRRTPILENCGLARIHCFRRRLPMMHRAEWQGRKANSGMAFAWTVWIRHYVGPAFVDRVSWS
jgi:hypothetical protein